ncbi:MAG: hypothetical protein JWN73_1183, partial [Betaproteobacteria bacterium]|nr:hypothetical protein [Betaproteobacteria bacterium]
MPLTARVLPANLLRAVVLSCLACCGAATAQPAQPNAAPAPAGSSAQAAGA